MRPLFRENFSDCTALLHSRLGEAFRALPAEEQRRHAERVIARALECRPRNMLMRMSILIDRQNPPDIERHRQKQNIWAVTFVDREAAMKWIIEAYSLGFSIFHHSRIFGPGSGLGHPCEEREQ